MVESNGALVGGGTDFSTHYYCTITGNGAEEGGGSSGGTFHYSIVYYNAAAKGPNAGGNMNSDGDGATDEQEHITDTCPTNAASFFRIATIPSASQPTICFQSSLNRHYTLFYATNLVGDGATPWFPVAGREDIPGTGGLLSLTDTNTNPQRFYKICVGIR